MGKGLAVGVAAAWLVGCSGSPENSPGAAAGTTTTGSTTSTSTPTSTGSAAPTGAGVSSEAPGVIPSAPGVPMPAADAPPCAAGQLAGVFDAGQALSPGDFSATIAVTNTGAGPCVLAGVDEVRLLASDGKPLPIERVRGEGAPVGLAPGAHAFIRVEYTTTEDHGMPNAEVPAGCLVGVASAQVVLPGDPAPVAAGAREAGAGYPPICGAVHTSAWVAG